MKSIVLLSAILMMLTACAVEGGNYSYGYYTGIKNPRVKRNSTTQTDETRTDETRQTEPAADAATQNDKSPAQYHRVDKGETLYSIAWAYGHDVREVASWNHIRSPYTIYPNQVLRTAPPTTTARPASHPTQSSNKKYTYKTSPAAQSSQRSRSDATKSTANSPKISWQWPTNGNIITKYSARDAGKKGLDIAGREGQAIHAAASGDIVYSGSGLRGYGKLIIIKHNDTYLSAYAHNKHLRVKDNQQVKKGQHIADMGSSEADSPMLHFEVRRNGKPVDPLGYLPKRR